MLIDGENLDHLYVRPGWQRGIGLSLFTKAKALSPLRLEVWTFQRNSNARAFYEAQGFSGNGLHGRAQRRKRAGREIRMGASSMNQLVPIATPSTPSASAPRNCFLEFFAANIRNAHSRPAYYRAAEEFLAWCGGAGVESIAAVQPVNVATWIEASTRELAAPSIKQRLAALRDLFDWLVNGQVVPVNPAHTVRGPWHVLTSGQTPILDPAEACALLDSIETGNHAGLRDRALIGLMMYSFARVGAALRMAVEDVFGKTAGSGCGYARRAASDARCRAITTSRNTLPLILTAPGCAAILRGRCFARSAATPVS
jgi:hypothetical protein